MKTNTGMYDRIVRVFIGMGIFGGAVASGIVWLIPIGMIVGLVLIVTGFIGYCPMYTVMRKYIPTAPEQTPAERRHTSRATMLLGNEKAGGMSGAESRAASNRTAFRD